MTIDEMLTRLEEDLRKLKIEYDIYFNGGVAKPPNDSKYRLEALIKRLYDARNMTFGQRFRYNSLVARYNVYKELWRRNVKDREEGTSAPAHLAPPPETPARKGFEPSTIRCTNPTSEPEKVRELYDNFILAKRACGERIQDISFDRFEKLIVTQSNQIKQKLNCDAIDFTVEVADGAVKFKAKAGS